jgi:hypothetical protein
MNRKGRRASVGCKCVDENEETSATIRATWRLHGTVDDWVVYNNSRNGTQYRSVKEWTYPCIDL